MTRTFTWRLEVRTYELDALGHVNNAVYARYLQEAATRASADAGYDFDWYEEHGTVWMVRNLYLRYHAPAFYGDELHITTWVADARRVQSQRDYEIRRAGDDALILRARTNWVYIDAATGRPQRAPATMWERFDPAGEVPDLGTRLRSAETLEAPYHYRHYRQAQCYEIDSLGHVNNAVYLNWLEQAAVEAMEAAGWPEARMQQQGFAVFNGSHEVEYLGSARFGDPIEIISYPCEIANVRGAWTQEIRHSETGELLVRDYNVGVFVDLAGRPIRAPAGLIEQLVAGPDSL